MAKLHFIFGSMGSAKTAYALIRKYNHEQAGHLVWFIKPSIDTRDGDGVIKSRIRGLESKIQMVEPDENLLQEFKKFKLKPDIVIVEEVNFITKKQVEQLRQIVNQTKTPVYCYGLRTDFKTNLFPASARLFELADSIEKIESLCDCGQNEAIVNARKNVIGEVVIDGAQVVVGGDDIYQAMCHNCYTKAIKNAKKTEISGRSKP